MLVPDGPESEDYGSQTSTGSCADASQASITSVLSAQPHAKATNVSALMRASPPFR